MFSALTCCGWRGRFGNSKLPDDFVEFDLAIRTAIDIAASPSTIWNWLCRTQDWKDSVASVERLDGAADAIGEVLRIGQRSGDTIVFTVLTTINQRPAEWKMQSLVTEDGRIPSGFVLNTLIPRGANTRLLYDLVARCRVPSAALNSLTVAQLAQAATQNTQTKMDADLEHLRRQVEASR